MRAFLLAIFQPHTFQPTSTTSHRKPTQHRSGEIHSRAGQPHHQDHRSQHRAIQPRTEPPWTQNQKKGSRILPLTSSIPPLDDSYGCSLSIARKLASPAHTRRLARAGTLTPTAMLRSGSQARHSFT